MNKNQKLLIKILSPIIILIILGLLFNFIDTKRFNDHQAPIFTIKIQNHDGSEITYWGLGYKIISHPGVSPKEPFSSQKSQKGSWFMKSNRPNQAKKPHQTSKIHSVADFYNLDFTKKHDIRNLPQTYTTERATQDKVSFNIISSQKTENFIQNYRNKQTAFMRTASTTIEGDVLFHDLLYYAPTDQLLVVIDNTRDKFLSYEDRTLLLLEYNGIEIVQNNHNKKLVVYQGDKYNPLTGDYSSLFINVIE